MTTQNTQPGPVKNRWTRWYMWAAYAAAVLVVGIIIAAVTSSGDSSTATPAEPVASATVNQTAEQADQIKEAAERQEEQTKTAENQAEETTEVSQDEYCDELNTYVQMIVTPSFDLLLRNTEILRGDLSLLEGIGDRTLDVMDSVDRGATGIKSMTAPESAKKTHRKSENLANDLLKITDDVRDKLVDYRKWLESEGNAEEAVERYRELAVEVKELTDKALPELGEIENIGYCKFVLQ